MFFLLEQSLDLPNNRSHINLSILTEAIWRWHLTRLLLDEETDSGGCCGTTPYFQEGTTISHWPPSCCGVWVIWPYDSSSLGLQSQSLAPRTSLISHTCPRRRCGPVTTQNFEFILWDELVAEGIESCKHQQRPDAFWLVTLSLVKSMRKQVCLRGFRRRYRTQEFHYG